MKLILDKSFTQLIMLPKLTDTTISATDEKGKKVSLYVSSKREAKGGSGILIVSYKEDTWELHCHGTSAELIQPSKVIARTSYKTSGRQNDDRW
jgi:hypothetical protein